MNVSLNLNGKWNIFYDRNEKFDQNSISKIINKKICNIPSVFNTSKEGAGYKGVVWYQKDIAIPPHNGIVELFLEGWYGKADFYLDNVRIGGRLYGYTPFSLYFKLPEKISTNSQSYTLSIRIDNREQEGQTFQTPVFRQWGGLHRNIELKLLSNLLIKSIKFSSDLKLDTLKDEKANSTINLEVKLYSTEDSIKKEPFIISGNLIDNSNKIIDQFSPKYKIFTEDIETMEYLSLIDENGQIRIGELKKFQIQKMNFCTESLVSLWSPDNPILYEIMINIEEIMEKIRVGFRKIEINNKGQLLLNGKPTLFLGVNRHDEHPEFGPAFNPQLIEHDLNIMKEAGFTGLRPAHYPTTDYFLDICDELGIMVIEEVPNYIMMPDMMKNPKILERGQKMFAEMIQAHINHPSIIAWSTANECKSHTEESKSMINELIKIGRNIDSTRLYHFTGYPGVQNIAEIDANIAAINVYYGDSTSGKKLGAETIGGVLDNLREFMEDEDLGMNNVTTFISEFGSQAVYGYHDIHPYHNADGYEGDYTIYTEERQAEVIEKFYDQIMDRRFVSGIMVWCWRDNRYEPEIADSAAGAIMRYGLLDWTGAPKLGFHILVRKIKELKKYRNQIE